MDRFDPFVKYADVYGDIINWEKDPMNKPQNQNKYFFSDGKTYYEQICKMLRLMSVFKEAFNQIYNNEDEISEAWENFVNNLSASVVEGSEPDVTLTWTDDSVNFEFTMVPGVPGEQGVGITSISFNSDYTMTITLSDGNTYTSMSLKGETGPQGPQGETGSGLQILDVYATLADLQSAHPTGQPGDAYQVGSAGNYTLYIWSSSQSAWVPAGSLGTVSPSVSNPLMDGTASAGSLNQYSRGDHVHPSDTSRASKEELDALIRTSQALIDQSFTYRESPAIQDGLARIDKIKGNTLVWNQLVGNIKATQTVNGVTYTNNSDGSISISGTASATSLFDVTSANINIVNGHKYLYKGAIGGSANCRMDLRASNGTVLGGTELTGTDIIFTATETVSAKVVIRVGNGTTVNNIKFIPQLFDLTKMFGAGNEPATVEEFALLFPLSYYDYNAGSLLSFNGSGIKTTGKNQYNNAIGLRNLYLNQNTGLLGNGGTTYVADLLTNKQYTLSGTRGNRSLIGFSKKQASELGNGDTIENISSVPLPYTFNSFDYHSVVYYSNNEYVATLGTDVQLEFGSATSYEPYTENTTNLPTLTYFPTGMKSAGSVYDELTPTKAITRIGFVDLGALEWTYQSANTRFYATISDMPLAPVRTLTFPNPLYESLIGGSISSTTNMAVYNGGNEKRIYIHNLSYTNASDFKTAMNGVYLYYELATPTETAVDLDLDFKAYENGTEQLLPVNGSVPSTSPVIADMTYLSIDDAMEYIIEKLANVPENTQQILESLEDDVADLQTDVGALQPAVSALQTSVGNINTNIGQLSSTVAGHTASISDMQSDIYDLDTGLSNLEDTVSDNTTRIGTLETGLSNTNGQVENLATSVSGLDSTVTAQGTTVMELDSIIQDISNNPVGGSIGNHELGFVVASVEATLPANTGTMVTIPKPTIFPNNYTPLFIVGMSTGSYNVSICSIPYTFGNNNSVTCRVWNHGSQQTTQISVYILCMRQRQSQ